MTAIVIVHVSVQSSGTNHNAAPPAGALSLAPNTPTLEIWQQAAALHSATAGRIRDAFREDRAMPKRVDLIFLRDFLVQALLLQRIQRMQADMNTAQAKSLTIGPV